MNLHPGESNLIYADTGITLLLLVGVAALGLAIGSFKLRGIGLGSTGVLFAGLIVGRFALPIDPATLHFVREFGLILFVFTMGLQLGPGFFAALRAEGLVTNLITLGIVTTGGLLVLGCGALLGLDPGVLPGLFSGSTTNTPSLGAAQQTMMAMSEISADQQTLPAMAYAAVYPLGILGIILTMLILKRLWRVDIEAETRQVQTQRQSVSPALERLNIEVKNVNLEGLPLKKIPGIKELQIRISRILPVGTTEEILATGKTEIHVGDTLLAVGTEDSLQAFLLIAGQLAQVDLMQDQSRVTFRRIVVTRKNLVGKALREIVLDHRLGVTITRVVRAGVEIPPNGDLKLQFGDFLNVVGSREGLEAAEKQLGNSLHALNATQFIPVFLGMGLGILLGMLPVMVPGLSSPLRLGLAGGPLVVAILLSRVGRIGPLIWHMPLNTNLAFRELGMVLFLATVGLGAGPKFFAIAFSPTGILWAACALVVSMVPLLIGGIIARKYLGMSFLSISGLLSGSMTDPPALAFATALTRSEEPSFTYATVYPMAMLSRIAVAQVLVLLMFG